MKLILYSGGDEEENVFLDQESIKLLNNKDPLIVFVPADSYDGEMEFQEFVARFQKFGVQRFIYFPIDVPQDQVLLGEVMASDFIFLGGGNTFYFLKYLRKSGFSKSLKSFVKRGGVLAGLSAGAIIMTPSICSASYPDFDCDENDEGIINHKGMGFVHFDFFPHYKNSIRYDRELKKQSKKINYPLYAIADGGGIIKDGCKIIFIGKSYCFFAGNKVNLEGKKALTK